MVHYLAKPDFFLLLITYMNVPTVSFLYTFSITWIRSQILIVDSKDAITEVDMQVTYSFTIQTYKLKEKMKNSTQNTLSKNSYF